MSRLKQLLLLCCILLSAKLGYPSEVKNHEQNDDGVSIIIIANIPFNGTDKSGSINASIEGHYLTLVFTQDLGQVAIEIATAAGAAIDCTSTITPNGLQFYIPNAGDYIVTFTLPNGDEYYGEFTVID